MHDLYEGSGALTRAFRHWLEGKIKGREWNLLGSGVETPGTMPVAPSRTGKVRLPWRCRSAKIEIVPQHPPAPLDKLLALAQGYADFAMRNIGHVPPALLADSPNGVIQFVPHSLKDVRAKDSFANTARLICLGYEVTAAVLVLEAWMKMARPGETLDMTEAPSESFDRQEVVVLTGETAGHGKQRLLPIIRTDAGGFFGFGEPNGPQLHDWQGRFAQLLPPKRPSAEVVEQARTLLGAMGITNEQLRGDVGQN